MKLGNEPKKVNDLFVLATKFILVIFYFLNFNNF